MSNTRGKDKALQALAQLEERQRALEPSRDAAMERALKQHLADREPLFQRRFELVSGKSEPSPEEMAGYKGPASDPSSKGKGLPCFWLNVLRSQDSLSECISARDAKALTYLLDVRFARGQRGMVVEFVFAENPYFENTILRRGIYVERDASGAPVALRDDASEIAWKDGACLLTKEVKGKPAAAAKKGKKGKKAGKAAGGGPKHGGSGGGNGEDEGEGEDEHTTFTTVQRRFKACPSLFRFFTPIVAPGASSGRSKVIDPTADEDDEEPLTGQHEEEDDEDLAGGRAAGGAGKGGHGASAEATNARRERDGELLELLVRTVIPRAVTLYLESGALGSSRPEGASDEEEQDSDGFELVSGAMRGAHAGGGDVASLPPHAQRLVHALKGLQSQIDELMLAYKRAKWGIKAEAEAAMQQMGDQRRDLVQGEPGGPPIVPNFWLRALRGLELGLDCVARRDERALAYLANLRLRWDFSRPMPSPEQPTRHATLELYFRSGNPYFTNAVLRKQYAFVGANGSASKLSLQSSDVLEGPAWVAGRDLTVRTAPDGKTRPAASFFALFKKGALRQAFNIVGEDRQSQQQAVQMEEQLLNEIQGSLLPQAYRLYDAVEIDDDFLEEEEEQEEEDEEDEEEEEEGDEEGEEEEEEGEERRPESKLPRRGRRRAGGAAAAATRRPADGTLGVLSDLWRRASGQWLLLLLLVLVAVGQVFVFLEMIPQTRTFLGY